MEKFIMTKDEDVAEKLRNLGYYMVAWDSDAYVFVNAGIARFSDNELKQVVFTNILPC